jgi:predicted nucleic acid-binding protein
MHILDDPDREFVTSDFVELEVLPKAIYNRKDDEADFYRTFIAAAQDIVRSSQALVTQAKAEAEQAGLSAVDALHVAAARFSRCDELVTTERPTSPLFRVTGLAIATIHDGS